jgi:hypothetical protein
MIKNQEIQDKNTGVHIAIGTTAGPKAAPSGVETPGNRWLRVTSPAVTTPGPKGETVIVKPAAISTVYFDGRGEVQRISAHDLTPAAAAPEVSPEKAAQAAVGETSARDSLPAWAIPKEEPPQAYFAPKTKPVDPPKPAT